jgi:glycosyltransferase involved in cell wall biosynthesis
MRMCDAFVENGVDMQYLHPSHGSLRKSVDVEDVAEYYGLSNSFEINTVPSLQSRFRSVPQVGLVSMIGSMTATLVKHVSTGRIDSDDTIYGRNYYGMFVFNEFKKYVPASRRPKMVFEHHDIISAHLKPRFFGSIDGLVCITELLARTAQDRYDIEPSRCFVAPDGVDLAPYRGITKSEARSRLDLPEEERIVMYTGHLYRSKGPDVLAQAAEQLDASVYIVGGYEDDVQRVRQNAPDVENLVLTGFVEPSEIPLYQIAADVLVAPYTEDAITYLSPLKLFEYMAAERPIVSSELEVLREVLSHEENALLVPPGDVEQLAEAIERALEDDELRERLTKQVRSEVHEYTWTQRAANILAFIDSL